MALEEIGVRYIVDGFDQAIQSYQQLGEAEKGAAEGAKNMQQPANQAGQSTKELAQSAQTAQTALSGFSQVAGKAGVDVSEFSNLSSKALDALKGFVQGGPAAETALLGFGTALGLAGAEAVNLATEWESSLTKIANDANLSSEQAKAVGDGLRDMAGDFVFSATEMADAIAGVGGKWQLYTGETLDAQHATELVSAAAKLAQADGSNLSSTLKALTDVLIAYKLPASDAVRVTDVLNNTSDATGLSVSTLSSGLLRLQSRLGEMAPPLEETSTLIAELSANGLQGNRAMMLVVTALNTLTGDSDAVKAKLAELNVQVLDANGSFVGMKSVIEQLAPAIAGMTDAQQKAALATIFGKGAAGVMGEVLKGGIDTWNRYADAIGKTGTTEEEYNRSQETTAVKLKEFGLRVEEAGRAMGEVLLGKIISVAEALSPLGDALSTIIGYWNDLPGPVKEAAGDLATLVGTLLAVDAGLKVLQFSFNLITAAFGAKTAATVVDTAATTANTAATEANAAAQGVQAAAVDGSTAAMGAGAVAGGGFAASLTGIGTAVVVAVAGTYALIKGAEALMSVFDDNKASTEDLTKSANELVNKWQFAGDKAYVVGRAVDDLSNLYKKGVSGQEQYAAAGAALTDVFGAQAAEVYHLNDLWNKGNLEEKYKLTQAAVSALAGAMVQGGATIEQYTKAHDALLDSMGRETDASRLFDLITNYDARMEKYTNDLYKAGDATKAFGDEFARQNEQFGEVTALDGYVQQLGILEQSFKDGKISGADYYGSLIDIQAQINAFDASHATGQINGMSDAALTAAGAIARAHSELAAFVSQSIATGFANAYGIDTGPNNPNWGFDVQTGFLGGQIAVPGPTEGEVRGDNTYKNGQWVPTSSLKKASGGGGGGGGSVSAQAAKAKEEGKTVGQAFSDGITEALTDNANTEKYGAAGASILSALTDAMKPDANASAGETLARTVDSLIDKARAAELPNADALGSELISALSDAIATGSPEAVARVQTLLAQIDKAIKDQVQKTKDDTDAQKKLIDDLATTLGLSTKYVTDNLTMLVETGIAGMASAIAAAPDVVQNVIKKILDDLANGTIDAATAVASLKDVLNGGTGVVQNPETTGSTGKGNYNPGGGALPGENVQQYVTRVLGFNPWTSTTQYLTDANGFRLTSDDIASIVAHGGEAALRRLKIVTTAAYDPNNPSPQAPSANSGGVGSKLPTLGLGTPFFDGGLALLHKGERVISPQDNALLSQLFGSSEWAPRQVIASLSRMAGTMGASSSGSLTVDMRGSTFSGTPAENAAAMEEAAQRVINRNWGRGALLAGVH